MSANKHVVKKELDIEGNPSDIMNAFGKVVNDFKEDGGLKVVNGLGGVFVIKLENLLSADATEISCSFNDEASDDNGDLLCAQYAYEENSIKAQEVLSRVEGAIKEQMALVR